MGTEPAQPVALALRALKLGDLLVAVPALRGLRRAFPEHRLVLAAPGWLAPIVSLVGAVDELLPTPGLRGPLALAPKSVDVAVNLHGNGAESRGALEALEPRRRIGHLAPGWDGPEWADGIHERTRWARLLDWHGILADPADLYLDVPDIAVSDPGAAVLHVGAFYGSRQWPVERFAAVAAALEASGHRVVFTGSAADRPRAQAVAEQAGLGDGRILAGELALDEFAATISAAALIVSADTGAAHLASAYRIPSVVLFGPAPPEEWGPPPGPHVVLTDASLRRGETFSNEPDPALLAVQPGQVLAALAELGVL
ncbi:MAG TPA: glycosyltransferase family 9 protein [Micrococcaceae bacterium]|nr:glycosyltransferase family 9 protein [Micrococcaceae bacterium]